MRHPHPGTKGTPPSHLSRCAGKLCFRIVIDSPAGFVKGFRFRILKRRSNSSSSCTPTETWHPHPYSSSSYAPAPAVPRSQWRLRQQTALALEKQQGLFADREAGHSTYRHLDITDASAGLDEGDAPVGGPGTFPAPLDLNLDGGDDPAMLKIPRRAHRNHAANHDAVRAKGHQGSWRARPKPMKSSCRLTWRRRPRVEQDKPASGACPHGYRPSETEP